MGVAVAAVAVGELTLVAIPALEGAAQGGRDGAGSAAAVEDVGGRGAGRRRRGVRRLPTDACSMEAGVGSRCRGRRRTGVAVAGSRAGRVSGSTCTVTWKRSPGLPGSSLPTRSRPPADRPGAARPWARRPRRPPAPARRLQGAQQHRTHFRRQPSAQHDHAVFVYPRAQRAAGQAHLLGIRTRAPAVPPARRWRRRPRPPAAPRWRCRRPGLSRAPSKNRKGRRRPWPH